MKKLEMAPGVDAPAVDGDLETGLYVEDAGGDDFVPEETPEDEGDEDFDDEEEDDLGEADSEQSEESEEPANSIFNKEQQAEINKLVKSRLERQKSAIVKDMTQAAGVDIQFDELAGASRLWGLLKSNPNLSQVIQGVIEQHLSEGLAEAPAEKGKSTNSRESDIERREAIVDLRLSDKTFNKNADKILEWASKEGLDVTDAKTLKLAYMAWKGAHDTLIKATEKATSAKQQAARQTMKSKAALQGSKASAKKPADFAKMSDSDVLGSLGIKLFTDD